MKTISWGPDQVTISCNREESDALLKMIAGLGYVACGREGMPLFAEKFAQVTPLPDPHLMAHFSPAPPNCAKYTNERTALKLKGLGEAADDSCCSLFVEHICGYDYTPENYARQAAKLSSFGFVCMRSPRGSEGRYWEHWFLPGLWSAKGRLKDAKSVEVAINILIQEIRPGSISAVRQRCALTID